MAPAPCPPGSGLSPSGDAATSLRSLQLLCPMPSAILSKHCEEAGRDPHLI